MTSHSPDPLTPLGFSGGPGADPVRGAPTIHDLTLPRPAHSARFSGGPGADPLRGAPTVGQGTPAAASHPSDQLAEAPVSLYRDHSAIQLVRETDRGGAGGLCGVLWVAGGFVCGRTVTKCVFRYLYRVCFCVFSALFDLNYVFRKYRKDNTPIVGILKHIAVVCLSRADGFVWR